MAIRLWGTFSARLPALRQLSTLAGPSTAAGDHGAGQKMWKVMSFVVAIPAVIVTYINATMKHHEEQELLKTEGRPKFVPYLHLRRRTKKFPWGDGMHTLFHNPETNPMPDGYEK